MNSKPPVIFVMIGGGATIVFLVLISFETKKEQAMHAISRFGSDA